MRPEKNPLDLNNFPEDFSKDGKQVYEDGSSSAGGGGGGGGHRKKKSGGKDGKDECGKVYECRFCSLKFCKSQALGGHMNRHRQERETEQLNNARQLVYSNDNNLAVQGRHLGCHPIGSGSYHPAAAAAAAGSIGDPFRSAAYPPRLFSGAATSPTLLQPPPPPPQPPYLYTSPSRHPSPYPPQYPPPPPSHQQPPINDYYIGHVLNNPNPSQQPYPPTHINFGNSESNNNNYTCIGAPVGFGPAGSGRGMSDQGSGRDGSSTPLSNQDQEGLNWGRSCSSHPASINRFQDGF